MSRRTTRRRIILAFSAVLGLFAIALVVMLLSLSRIAAAETEVARLDHVKHAGHQAAALAREQYIHQAHTLIEWNESLLGHYRDVALAAREATENLRKLVTGAAARAQADEIARLVVESDLADARIARQPHRGRPPRRYRAREPPPPPPPLRGPLGGLQTRP